MLVDYEKVCLALKAYVAAKPSHGARDLLAELAELESKHQLEEGLPEKALRLYGVVLTDALTRPALAVPRVDPLDGPDDGPERRSEADTFDQGEADVAGHAGRNGRRAVAAA